MCIVLVCVSSPCCQPASRSPCPPHCLHPVVHLHSTSPHQSRWIISTVRTIQKLPNTQYPILLGTADTNNQYHLPVQLRRCRTVHLEFSSSTATHLPSYIVVPSWSENWTVYQIVSVACSWLFLSVRMDEHNFSTHHHHHHQHYVGYSRHVH